MTMLCNKLISLSIRLQIIKGDWCIVILLKINKIPLPVPILKYLHHGVTIFKGKGGYTGQENTIVFTVVDRKGFIKLKKFIKENDPEAFITVNEAAEVLGKGFKEE